MAEIRTPSGATVDSNTGQLLSEPGAIPVSDIQADSEKPFNVPPAPQARDFSSFADSSLESIMAGFNQPTQEEQFGRELQQDILGTTQQLGTQAQRREELRGEAGLPEQEKQLQSLVGQLQGLQKERLAIPLEVQQEFAGRGATRGGVAPIETGRLRENTIQALKTSAIAQTIQGNVQLAQQNIQNALEAEFEPLRTRLQVLGQLYEFNKDALQRVDKKRAQQLEITLNERARQIQKQENQRKGVYDVGLLASKYNAPADVVNDILNSQTPEEALRNAGVYIQDPQAKLEMRNAILDNKIKEVELTQKQEELNIFRKYGGLTPEQHRKQIEEQQKLIQAENEVDQQALEDSLLLTDSINQIDAVLNSNALDDVVGGSILSRGVGRQKGFVSTLASFTTKGFSGITAELTGRADDTVALTQQILDQQFLDKLISVKSKGATFGALSDNEGNALRNAANAIAGTAIKSGSVEKGTQRVIGYDMSESEFKNQMEQIKFYMDLARQRATGDTFTSDEQDLLDTAFGEGEFNPAF